MAGIDLMLPAIIKDLLAQSVLADQPGGQKRKRSAGLGEVNQNVVRSAPVPWDWLRILANCSGWG